MMSYGEMKAAAKAIEDELQSLGFTSDECITILGVTLTHFITRHPHPREAGERFYSSLIAVLTITDPDATKPTVQ